jgi:hypothetical protein
MARFVVGDVVIVPLFTTSQSIITYKAGEILPSKLAEVIDKIVEILHVNRW